MIKVINHNSVAHNVTSNLTFFSCRGVQAERVNDNVLNVEGGVEDDINSSSGDVMEEGVVGDDGNDEAMGGDVEMANDERQEEVDAIDDDTWLASMTLKWKLRGKCGDRELKELFQFLNRPRLNLCAMRIKSLTHLKKFHQNMLMDRLPHGWTTAEFQSPICNQGLIEFHFRCGLEAVTQLFGDASLGPYLELKYKRMPEDETQPRIRSTPTNSDWWEEAQVSITSTVLLWFHDDCVVLLF